MGTNLLRNTHQELQRKEKGNDNFDKEYYFRNRAASAEEKVRTAWSYSWLGCHVRLLLYFLISTLVYLGWRLLLSLSLSLVLCLTSLVSVERAGERTNVNSRRPKVWNVDSKSEFTLSREWERQGEGELRCVR